MALEGMELIVVLIIVVVVLLWGPKKLPELAKGIGEARREFSKASQEPTTATAPVAAAPVAAPIVAAPAAVAPVAPTREEDMLILTARKLGIYTEGKTRDQISAEIVNKAASTKVRKQPAKTEETGEE